MKLAYVTGSRFTGYRLLFRDMRGMDGQTEHTLSARAEYARLDGMEFSLYRAAQNIANAINATACGKIS